MIMDKNFSQLPGYQIPAHSLGSKIFVPRCFLIIFIICKDAFMLPFHHLYKSLSLVNILVHQICPWTKMN
jgi:hypothetical protein